MEVDYSPGTHGSPLQRLTQAALEFYLGQKCQYLYNLQTGFAE